MFDHFPHFSTQELRGNTRLIVMFLPSLLLCSTRFLRALQHKMAFLFVNENMLHLGLTMITKILVFLKVMQFAEKQIPFVSYFLFSFLFYRLFVCFFFLINFFGLLNEETLRHAVLRDLDGFSIHCTCRKLQANLLCKQQENGGSQGYIISLRNEIL